MRDHFSHKHQRANACLFLSRTKNGMFNCSERAPMMQSAVVLFIFGIFAPLLGAGIR